MSITLSLDKNNNLTCNGPLSLPSLQVNGLNTSYQLLVTDDVTISAPSTSAIINAFTANNYTGSIPFPADLSYGVSGPMYLSNPAVKNTYIDSSWNSGIYASAYDSTNSIVYVGGTFTTVGNGITARKIAGYNCNTNTWFRLSGGLTSTNSACFSLLYDNSSSNLYVGGIFTTAGGVSVNNIARYNTSSRIWYDLCGGLTGTIVPGGGVVFNTACYSLLYVNNTLYAGGAFTAAGGVSVKSIACYSPGTNSWSKLPGDTAFNHSLVNSLACYDQYGTIMIGYYNVYTPNGGSNPSGLYIISNNYIIQLVPTPGIVYDIYYIRAMTFDAIHNKLYFASCYNNFDVDYAVLNTQPDSPTSLYVFDVLSGSVTLLSNNFIPAPSNTKYTLINSLTMDPTKTTLYIGGNFSGVGSVQANNIVAYSPQTGLFSAINSNPGSNGLTKSGAYTYAQCNTIINTNTSTGLIVGGIFDNAGGVSVNNIMKYAPGPITITYGSNTFTYSSAYQNKQVIYDATTQTWGSAV